MATSDPAPLDSLPEFSSGELKRNCGRWGKPIYLAIKGVIYDVSQAPELYGPDGPYHIFAGRECARSLAALDLSEKMLTDKTDDLDDKCQSTLSDWIAKFNTRYPVVGKVSKRRLITAGTWFQIGALGLVATICFLGKRAT
ncbi:hypothetical protein BSKO_10028 [Bryopsis sp. KO-2023]|nr:hypothetical protein BSKO_10028 [Bryopsis sp. KO-2023]